MNWLRIRQIGAWTIVLGVIAMVVGIFMLDGPAGWAAAGLTTVVFVFLGALVVVAGVAWALSVV